MRSAPTKKNGEWWGYSVISVLITLAFFYQPYTWRKALWSWVMSFSDNPFYVGVVGSMLVHTSAFIVMNTVMYVIYKMNHPFFEQFKVQKKSWPWQRGSKEREEWYALVIKALKLIAFNELIVVPILFTLNYPTTKKFNSMKIEDLPSWTTSLWQICLCMVIEDTSFYWLHRFMHWAPIYGRFHKVHHQYKTTVGIASEYSHPVDFVLSSAIPYSAGPLILGVHTYTLWMWALLRTGETTDGHCGYEFPWSPYRLLPFSGSSSYHDYHHSHNVGNFSSFFTWWDHLNGTNADYYKFLEKQEKLDQQPSQPTNGADKDITPEADKPKAA